MRRLVLLLAFCLCLAAAKQACETNQDCGSNESCVFRRGEKHCYTYKQEGEKCQIEATRGFNPIPCSPGLTCVLTKRGLPHVDLPSWGVCTSNAVSYTHLTLPTTPYV
eukprot:TRINITY_DN2402_c0_g1_i3.p1 TRINITY_DN2402_c0_g1~~TRINITY_DN2402_c0_g1_i3.p1  ORF type:complete len:126 (-),score=7.23 TRINITY_DN2402_c0_g1_i3:3-326(-)